MKKFREVIVLSLLLLLFLPDMSMHFLMPNDGTRMWTLTVGSTGQPADPCMCPRFCHTLQVTADNIEEAFKGNNELYQKAAALSIDKISVYKSPLSAPFSSSKDSVRSVMQDQYLSVDYHAYVVFNTSDGMWWALDKTDEGIFVSRGESFYSVTLCFDGRLRPKSTCGKLYPLISDESDHTFSDVVRRLTKILKSNRYDLIGKNCQHFAREIFNKFAIDETWELSTVTDLTSPLTMLRNNGFNLAKLLYIAFLFYELYLLSGESREKESYHHLFVVYTVIIVTGIVLLIDFLWLILPYSLLGFLIYVKLYVILIALYLEAQHYSFLGTIRKRAIQYRKKCQLATWFEKLRIPLGYTMVYVGPVSIIICMVLIKYVGMFIKFVYYWFLYPQESVAEFYVDELFDYCSEISIFVPITILYMDTFIEV